MIKESAGMKKIFALIIAATLIWCVCFAVSVRENDTVYANEDNVLQKSIYIVSMEENHIVLYEIFGEDKRIIKKAPGMPGREADRIKLEEGIEAESFEDALMIFEDFVS